MGNKIPAIIMEITTVHIATENKIAVRSVMLGLPYFLN